MIGCKIWLSQIGLSMSWKCCLSCVGNMRQAVHLYALSTSDLTSWSISSLVSPEQSEGWPICWPTKVFCWPLVQATCPSFLLKPPCVIIIFAVRDTCKDGNPTAHMPEPSRPPNYWQNVGLQTPVKRALAEDFPSHYNLTCCKLVILLHKNSLPWGSTSL